MRKDGALLIMQRLNLKPRREAQRERWSRSEPAANGRGSSTHTAHELRPGIRSNEARALWAVLAAIIHLGVAGVGKGE